MNQIDRLRIERYKLHRLGPAATADVLGEIVARVGGGLCQRCGQTDNDLNPNALITLRRPSPDVRPLVVAHPQGGRA